jgi:hypothetical protein
MAVLVEGISVVIRRDAIAGKLDGGWQRFIGIVPNRTLCYDDFLARVGFMSPMDVENFCNHLVKMGLSLFENVHFADMAVVDQREGPTMPCDWLQFRHIEFMDPPMKIASAAFIPPDESGNQPEEGGFRVSFPENWKYENSLSQEYQFTPLEEITARYQFLRHEKGIDVLLDRETGKVVYRAQTSRPSGKRF